MIPKRAYETFGVTLWDQVDAEAHVEIDDRHLVRRPRAIGPLDESPPDCVEVHLHKVTISSHENYRVEVDVLPVLSESEREDVIEQVLESIEEWD